MQSVADKGSDYLVSSLTRLRVLRRYMGVHAAVIGLVVGLFLAPAFVVSNLAFSADRAVPKEIIQDFILQAEDGNLIAEVWLGSHYYRLGSYSEAMKWLLKAAHKGESSAMTHIGFMYANGQGVSQDYEEAMKWFREAAHKGEAIAMKNIGVMYAKGHGVRQDHGEAVKWFQRGAEAGDADSMYMMAKFFQVGRGVQKNYGKAAEWTLRAALSGHPMAIKNLEEAGIK